jgi:hypothetical protein
MQMRHVHCVLGLYAVWYGTSKILELEIEPRSQRQMDVAWPL